jgi:hypothetical protein
VVLRGVGAVCLAVGTVVLAAEPAGAHGVGGIQPSNFVTEVTGVSPAVPGLSVRVRDLGNKLELDNGTGADVTVLGYQEEPYLRVGRAGVYENVRSPAVYLNRTRTGTGQVARVPGSANPAAPPTWRRVSGGTTVRWHDHRAHWLGTANPPQVQAEPGSRHLVQRWSMTLLADRTRITVRGVVEWIPGPSPWPWIGAALGLAALAVGLAQTRLAGVVMSTALVVMIAAETTHIVGSWDGTTVAASTKLVASAYALGGIALGAMALVWVWRRGVLVAAPLLLFAGLFLVLAGGLGDVTYLYRSQLPTSLPNTWARLEITTVIGLGLAVAIVGGRQLKVTPTRVEPATPKRLPVRPELGAAPTSDGLDPCSGHAPAP